MSSLDNTIYTREEPLDPHIRIDVHRLTVRSAEINWTPIPNDYFNTPESVAYLQISDSPTSEFETVHEITQRHPPFYIDESFMSTYYRSPVIYYKLVFPDVNKESRVFSSEKEPNFYAAEIIRRHLIQLREGHAGNLMYLFIRRRLKERCPDCWDTLRGQRSKANCPTCLNTGYIQGYYNPIALYMSLSAENTAVRQAYEGTEIQGNLQGWTAGYPRISMGDCLVDANTREIWNVSQIGMTTHKRVITKQEVVLQHQDEDLAIFQLLQRIPITPERRDLRHGEIIF